MNSHLRIGMLIERSRAFGRGVLEGAIDRVQRERHAEIALLDPIHLRRKHSLDGIDGFIARVTTEAIAHRLAMTGKPVVDLYYERQRPGFAIVKTRHETVGRLAAEHFLERRFVNFAYCPFGGGRTSAYCYKAFSRRLHRAGFSCNLYPGREIPWDFGGSTLVDEEFRNAPDAVALSKWLKSLPKPIALFTPADIRAWQIASVAAKAGICIPDEIALLGFDNDLIICGAAKPMLSSVDPDAQAIGRLAAETLFEMIAGRLKRNNIVRQVPPLGVVRRESSDTFPIEPKWVSDALIFIHANFANGITASDVFAHVGISHTAVNRAFRKAIGCTVQHAIIAERINAAKRLLAETDLSASDIATRTGFASDTYFSQTFTAAIGQSPISYRTTNRTRFS